MTSGLFLPATEQELRDFSGRLTVVSNRLSGNMLDPHHVEFDAKIYHGDGSLGRITFSHTMNDADSYALSLSQFVPIDNTWDQELAQQLLGDDYTGFNRLGASPEEIAGSLAEEDRQYFNPEELPDNGIVEGYVEHQTELKIIREGRLNVDAMKSVYMNIVTPEFDEIDTHVGISRHITSLSDEEETKDIQAFATGEAGLVDFEFAESLLNVPTPADLIMFTNALIRVGLLGKRTIAFRGAGPHMDIPVLPLLQPTVGY